MKFHSLLLIAANSINLSLFLCIFHLPILFTLVQSFSYGIQPLDGLVKGKLTGYLWRSSRLACSMLDHYSTTTELDLPVPPDDPFHPSSGNNYRWVPLVPPVTLCLFWRSSNQPLYHMGHSHIICWLSEGIQQGPNCILLILSPSDLPLLGKWTHNPESR